MLSDGLTRGPNWFLKRETFAAVRERLFADRQVHSTRKLLCNLGANSFLGEALNEARSPQMAEQRPLELSLAEDISTMKLDMLFSAIAIVGGSEDGRLSEGRTASVMPQTWHLLNLRSAYFLF